MKQSLVFRRQSNARLGTNVAHGECVVESRSLEQAQQLARDLEKAISGLESDLSDAEDSRIAANRLGWVRALRANVALVSQLLDCVHVDEVGLSRAVSVREEGKRIVAFLEGEVARRDDAH